jgi:hypothetical protein
VLPGHQLTGPKQKKKKKKKKILVDLQSFEVVLSTDLIQLINRPNYKIT